MIYDIDVTEKKQVRDIFNVYCVPVGSSLNKNVSEDLC